MMAGVCSHVGSEPVCSTSQVSVGLHTCFCLSSVDQAVGGNVLCCELQAANGRSLHSHCPGDYAGCFTRHLSSHVPINHNLGLVC